MLAAARNCDVMLQMRNHLSHLETPLKKDMNILLSKLRILLISGKNIKQGIDILVPLTFSFRIKAIKWLIEENEFEILSIVDEISPEIEVFKENPKLDVLTENILFALRCSQKVLQSISLSEGLSEDSFSFSTSNLPIITYDQFLASIAYSNLDDITCQKIADWTNMSLYIKLIVLSGAIINDENLKVSNKTINELAFIIGDAAQEYSAIAIELGILKPSPKRLRIASGQPDKNYIREQKNLAELGLNDFAEKF
jgi:hypothetical protein